MGRTTTIKQFISPYAFSLSIGAGLTRFAKVNVDISISKGIDVLCSASHLPFADGSFEEIVFTDVIEHLPKGSEINALKELARVLRRGKVLLTTPNQRWIFTLLDPAYWLAQHRHYTRSQMNRIVKAAGLKVESEGTFGSPFELLRLLFMYSTYPIKRLAGSYPQLFDGDEKCPDQIRRDDLGYTRFMIVRK